jgi:hypothetical protein
MSDPPRAALREAQDGTYGVNDWADFHEAMAEEAEYRRRLDKKGEQDRKSKARR